MGRTFTPAGFGATTEIPSSNCLHHETIDYLGGNHIQFDNSLEACKIADSIE